MGKVRSPEEKREYQESHQKLREMERRRKDKRPVKRNGSRERGFEVVGVKIRCDICGYDQEDVMVFEDLETRTRMGPIRVKICPTCQPETFRNNPLLRTVGLASEVLKPIPDSGVEARVVMF